MFCTHKMCISIICSQMSFFLNGTGQLVTFLTHDSRSYFLYKTEISLLVNYSKWPSFQQGNWEVAIPATKSTHKHVTHRGETVITNCLCFQKESSLHLRSATWDWNLSMSSPPWAGNSSLTAVLSRAVRVFSVPTTSQGVCCRKGKKIVSRWDFVWRAGY